MSRYPYTILSSAISLDGFLDDTSGERLLLSGPEDFNRVDEVRASCDGILVGAHTLRVDNPSLRIRSQALVEKRLRTHNSQDLIRITLTSSGNLPPSHAFFRDSDSPILVYCTSACVEALSSVLQHTDAEVISAGDNQVSLQRLMLDLKSRGVHRLLIEGGQQIATVFLAENLVNELHIAVAPFFVGEQGAPRLVGPGTFPYNKTNRMRLHATAMAGDMAVLTYKLDAPQYETDVQTNSRRD